MEKVKLTSCCEMTIDELLKVVREHSNMEKELIELKRRKESLVDEWHINNSKHYEAIKRKDELEKKLKNQKRKSKNKYRKMKIEMMAEIMYLKSKLYEKNNIYHMKREKTQNIVKLYK